MNVQFVLLMFLLKLDDMVNGLEQWTGAAHVGMSDVPSIAPSTTTNPVKSSELDIDLLHRQEMDEILSENNKQYADSQDFKRYYSVSKLKNRRLGGLEEPSASNFGSPVVGGSEAVGVIVVISLIICILLGIKHALSQVP